MQFDNIIQVGVWLGSAEQIAVVQQTAHDAIFKGHESIAQYLATIDEAHSDDSIDFDRGEIAVDAWECYAPIFRDAWDRAHNVD